MLNCNFVFQTKNAWKFPGGLSDPGEDIGECSTEQKTNTVHLAKSFHFSVMRKDDTYTFIWTLQNKAHDIYAKNYICFSKFTFFNILKAALNEVSV